MRLGLVVVVLLTRILLRLILILAGHTLTVNEIPSHRHTGLDIDSVYIFGWDTGSTRGYRMDNASLGGLTNTANRITTSYTGGGASHSHGNTGSTTPGNTGSSSNLPPYKVVYAWERTA